MDEGVEDGVPEDAEDVEVDLDLVHPDEGGGGGVLDGEQYGQDGGQPGDDEEARDRGHRHQGLVVGEIFKPLSSDDVHADIDEDDAGEGYQHLDDDPSHRHGRVT